MKKRLLLSIEQREDWVNKWRSSGLSGAQFAARHHLNESTLYRWGQRFDQGARPHGASTALTAVSARRFTEVRLGSGETEGRIEVTLGDGRVVRVMGRVERSQLQMVLEALGAC